MQKKDVFVLGNTLNEAVVPIREIRDIMKQPQQGQEGI